MYIKLFMTYKYINFSNFQYIHIQSWIFYIHRSEKLLHPLLLQKNCKRLLYLPSDKLPSRDLLKVITSIVCCFCCLWWLYPCLLLFPISPSCSFLSSYFASIPSVLPSSPFCSCISRFFILIMAMHISLSSSLVLASSLLVDCLVCPVFLVSSMHLTYLSLLHVLP